MGLLAQAFASAERSTRPPDDDFWYSPLASPNPSGVAVTPSLALSISAVYACVRLIASTVGSLPLFVYRRLANGGKERATGHPNYRLLHLAPNPWQTAMELREMLCGHLVLRGNAYAHTPWGRSGYPQAIIPLHPDRIKVSVLPNGDRAYEYRDADNRVIHYAQDEVLHLRNISNDGVMGLSPLSLAANTFGFAHQVDAFGSRFFRNYARPAGALKLPPQKALTEEQHERMKNDFERNYGGENAHRVILLEGGLEWQALSVSNEDAQFLETRKFNVSDIARVFQVPPHLIGDLERATFSNIEHQALEFVIHTIRPWLVRWEQAINLALFTQPEQAEYFAEHQVDALLRGDIKSRYEAYESAINPQRGAWMTRNEVRALENLNPLPGLDEPPPLVNPMAQAQGGAQ